MKETTGERIKRLRTERKMSVTEFADKVGTSRMQIYRYESDQIEKMSYKVLIPIAKALGTTPTYLLGMDDEPRTEYPKNLDKNIKKWFDAVGELNFSDKEFDELVNYAKFIISKRKKEEDEI